MLSDNIRSRIKFNIIDMAETILISSFNCRGLRNKNKRIGLFQWLKDRYKGIIFLQETHSVDADEEKWEREWGSKINFAHDSSVSKSVPF